MAKNNFWKTRQIFPSITTTKNSDWRKKIKETTKLGLTEVCVFLTCLNKKERDELYKLLEKSSVKKVPLAHIRSDMTADELEYFVKKFKTETFNTHSELKYPFKHNLDRHRELIFIENTVPLVKQEIRKFAGICLDLSHLENDRLFSKQEYHNDVQIIENFVCGCNHISAVRQEPYKDDYGFFGYDSHILENLSEMDYLKKYPARYFSSVLALELENSIKEQLEIKDYIIELLRNR